MSLLLQDAFDAGDGFGKAVDIGGVGETQMTLWGVGAKVKAGCCRDARRFQQGVGELLAVFAETAAIGVEIEGAGRSGVQPEADALKFGCQEVAAALKLGTTFLDRKSVV